MHARRDAPYADEMNSKLVHSQSDQTWHFQMSFMCIIHAKDNMTEPSLAMQLRLAFNHFIIGP